jgi:hypothetical protein
METGNWTISIWHGGDIWPKNCLPTYILICRVTFTSQLHSYIYSFATLTIRSPWTKPSLRSGDVRLRAKGPIRARHPHMPPLMARRGTDGGNDRWEKLDVPLLGYTGDMTIGRSSMYPQRRQRPLGEAQCTLARVWRGASGAASCEATR